jgi:hypothetical protein
MRLWLLEHEDSTHTRYSVTHLLCRHIGTHIKLIYIQLLYEILNQELAAFHLLFQKKRGRLKTTRIRKQDRHQKKKTRCSNLWCRQEGHNKRSCRTANDNRVLAQREDSDTEVEVEVEVESRVVDIPIRRRGSRERRRRE